MSYNLRTSNLLKKLPNILHMQATHKLLLGVNVRMMRDLDPTNDRVHRLSASVHSSAGTPK
jgi:hypothetical protein